ncbi:MAG TPA: polyprenyl synthetase family protein, partial [Gemmatimonadales bacterium]|nr:polyprenyl synthetase family protein [Gemmatimonadales bacterium]
MAEGAEPGAAAILESARERVDRRLAALAERIATEIPGRLGGALGYALSSPGKRVRPALLLAAYRACGGECDAVDGLATAVEIVHTYSLIHDDLPCMDNDALRRGRATTHVRFDLTTATRAGYLLVPVAAHELAAAARELGLAGPVVRHIAI